MVRVSPRVVLGKGKPNGWRLVSGDITDVNLIVNKV